MEDLGGWAGFLPLWVGSLTLNHTSPGPPHLSSCPTHATHRPRHARLRENRTSTLTHSSSYKTAEHCTARLSEMQHSLTSMIDEVNASSAQLSSSTTTTAGGHPSSSSQQHKPDDPLAEIVRVLNGHLAQLQAIDAGAAGLQGRVGAAQKEARGLLGGSSSGGAVGGGGGMGEAAWVEGFGRSFLGRGA